MPSDRDVFANFERMRRQIDELFGDALGGASLAPRRRDAFAPPVDVYYADDPPRAVVNVELAGIELESVALDIQGRELVIAGLRRPGASAGRVYQQVEIQRGPFRRRVALGADVDGERAQALYKDGILRVELPLVAPESRTRRVPVRRSDERPARARQ